MRVTQDLNSFGEIIAHVQCSVDEKKLKYIPCVPHKNNCKTKIGKHDMKQTDSSIIIVRNVCVLFIHVSSRNMFPTTRNLQIRVHVYRSRRCCGVWLTFGCFVPMIADHNNLVKKSFGPMIADHDLVKKR
jgi:hypothetical protein